MAGNKNSGRKVIYDNPVQIHFHMEGEDVDILNEIAKKFSNGNRTVLIKETLQRVIDQYEKSK